MLYNSGFYRYSVNFSQNKNNSTMPKRSRATIIEVNNKIKKKTGWSLKLEIILNDLNDSTCF